MRESRKHGSAAEPASVQAAASAMAVASLARMRALRAANRDAASLSGSGFFPWLPVLARALPWARGNRGVPTPAARVAALEGGLAGPWSSLFPSVPAGTLSRGGGRLLGGGALRLAEVLAATARGGALGGGLAVPWTSARVGLHGCTAGASTETATRALLHGGGTLAAGVSALAAALLAEAGSLTRGGRLRARAAEGAPASAVAVAALGGGLAELGASSGWPGGLGEVTWGTCETTVARSLREMDSLAGMGALRANVKGTTAPSGAAAGLELATAARKMTAQ